MPPLVLDGTNGVSGVDGTASNPAIEGTDSNTGIFYPAADTVAIGTGGTERLRVDSAGNAGLAVTPSAWRSTSRAIQFGAGGFVEGRTDNAAVASYGANAYLDSTGAWRYLGTGTVSLYQQAGGHFWYNAASGTAGNAVTLTNAMALDASGNLDVYGDGKVGQGKIAADSTVGNFAIYGGLAGGSTNSRLSFFGKSVSNTGQTYEIARIAGSSFGTYSLEGGIQFSTASNNGSNVLTLAERARITSGGALWVGNTTDGSPAGNARIISYRNTAGNSFFAHQDVATNDTTAVIRQSVSGGNGGQNIGLLVQIEAASNTDRIICGQYWNAGTPQDRFLAFRNGDMQISGAVATKSTGTTWANPSDIRLKDNVRDYEKGLAELIQVRVREWEYNGKGGTTEGTHGLGVVADEVMLVLPRTVDEFEAKLNENDEEKTKLKRFDATEITWLLVKSIQELNAKVEAQAAEIAALKGNA